MEQKPKSTAPYEPAPSDIPLLDAARAGSQEAFRQLYLRHVQASYWLAHSIVGNPHDAEDIVQETFITCYKKLASIEIFGESLLPWLLVTTKFTALNRYRMKQRRREFNDTDRLENVPEKSDIAENLEYQEALSAIAQVLERMSELDQKIYHSCIIEEKSYAEAALEHGVSNGSIRNRLMRIRKKVQDGLERNSNQNDSTKSEV